MAALIALLGGTFDPVHIGHLRAAFEAAHALGATVHLMPAQVPPHRAQPVASAQQRRRMLEIAVADRPELAVDARELARNGPSFTVDTLHELRVQHGADRPIALIVGADAFAGLPTWSRWRDLFELAHLVVLNRPGAATAAHWAPELSDAVAARRCVDAAELHAASHGKVLELAITPLAVSATQVREGFARGEAPHWLVPAEVLAYIEREGLYR
jgi:nicotinate-nucleotide adenylyltransferase